MNEVDSSNLAQIASQYVNSTGQHIFLTGRAGTGKTTFLKKIVEKTHKKCVVAAPTGIAAINAEGVTLHSLLQLPFGCFIPSEISQDMGQINIEINTPNSIRRERRMNKTKQALLKEMELLIIDEVSMLRADLLDAIDTVLKSVRRQRHIPFGGVQILFIGDLLQLPPVIKEVEWKYLSTFYKSAYFFEAHALQNNKPVYIELEKIYRQSNQEFIEILSRFRNNKPTQKDLDRVNETFTNSFSKKIDEGYIYITTHNYKADEKNQLALNNLKGKTKTFQAEVKDDFPEHNYPIEFNLELKKGARVMFIKNDVSGLGRYYNGKIGTISELDEEIELIEVSFDDNSEPVSLEYYTWENKRYTLNSANNEIEEKVIGTFSHYPIKLAWAVTVHKSQGLTFEKAVLDLSEAFAPGQVYVALSRLRTLDGLVLSSKISANSLNIDEHISNYSENKSNTRDLDQHLKKYRQQYIEKQALKAFDFSVLKRELNYHYNSYDKDAGKSTKQKHKQWAAELLKSIDNPLSISQKFLNQINRNIQKSKPDLAYLHERISAAKKYFEPILKEFSKRILDKIDNLANVKAVKTYINELKDLENVFFRQLYFIYKSESIIKAAIEHTELQKKDFNKTALYTDRQDLTRNNISLKAATNRNRRKKERKPPKPKTQEITWNLYKEGKSVEEIATERGLTTDTIRKHFLPFIKKGEVKITEFIESSKVQEITDCINKTGAKTLWEIRQHVGQSYTWEELRMVKNSMEE